ncbi:hypothetical protein M0R45_000541 [Rubus argutus]|uniref:Uncharacterized protein n=1 Tax=Rubus argutus TaxID=59490 RepID=A0AAW1VL69_RUBAR
MTAACWESEKDSLVRTEELERAEDRESSRELEIDAGMHRDEDAAERGGSCVAWTAAAAMESELGSW